MIQEPSAASSRDVPSRRAARAGAEETDRRAIPDGLRAPPAELRRTLLGWYERERRDLPWRRTRDPYAIWISEAMLQQTRVETVVPYFARFLARFPDVAALAAAREEDVLAAWSGLGYYSRARALRAAARTIVERHGGAWPRTRGEWLALPGVGPYTAGAVLSIAFAEPEAAVDGNVQRVLARLAGIEAPLGSARLVGRAWELARALVPRDVDGAGGGPGAWSQALMELGATVCTARAPACGRCPLAGACAARSMGRAEALPLPRPRRATVDVRLEVLVVRSERGWLLVERPRGGRMAGLLEPPTRELARGAPRLWPETLPGGLALVPGDELGELAHAITHHRVRATVRAAELAGPVRTRRERKAADAASRGAVAEAFVNHLGSERVRWAREDELGGLALTGIARKVVALVRRQIALRKGAPRPR